MDHILIDRLDWGVDLYKRCEEIPVIVAARCGGRDKEFVERTGKTEADFMKNFILDKGVLSTFVYQENKGENTFDCTSNAYYGIIVPNNWQSGHIISSREHLPRVILQTMKVMPLEMHLEFSGPSINDPEQRKKILEHEVEAIRYTLSRDD